MPWRDEIISNPTVGAAHGGILSALIDLTGLYTVIAMGGSARATANLHVDFHRPALPGLMRAIGRPVKLGRQISIRSDERRAGKACVKPCRSGWSADHYKKKARVYMFHTVPQAI